LPLLSGILGSGIVVVWANKEEDLDWRSKALVTAVALALFAGIVGVTVPAAQGAGPAHDINTIWNVLVAIMTSSLALAVLLGAGAGAIVTGYIMIRNAAA